MEDLILEEDDEAEEIIGDSIELEPISQKYNYRPDATEKKKANE